MTEIYDEHYESTAYEDYDTDEYGYEDEFYGEEEYVDDEDMLIETRRGWGRGLRILLMLLLVLLIVGVVIFGVIPYVEAMTHVAPSLSPAVQA